MKDYWFSRIANSRNCILSYSFTYLLLLGPHLVCSFHFQQWYFLSKTLAEEAAWKFAKENGIDLVTMNPGLVIGPLLQPTLNLTSELIVVVVKGNMLTSI